MQAAVGLAQLKKLPQFVEKRKGIAAHEKRYEYFYTARVFDAGQNRYDKQYDGFTRLR